MSIEVETKLCLDKNEVKRLLDGAEYLKLETNKDTYFDTREFELMKEGMFLRNRNGQFELKSSIYNFDNAWREVTDQDEILEYLDYERDECRLNAFADIIDWYGCCPVASFWTHRQKYIKAGIKFCVDHCDFGYDVVEIERVVSVIDEVKDSQLRIANFVKSHGFENAIKGVHKFQAYLDSKRISHP